VQIEGIDVTDETVGMSVANFSTDAVQEFNLARSSFDLSTSLTTSGAVSIASRTGGNQFNGSVFWFLQRDAFDARPGFAAEKPKFSRDQYGYRFGGPIIKDKLFFFSNAEKFDQQDFSDFSSTNFPSFNGNSTLPIKIFNSLHRLDYHATDKLRFFYLFNHSDDDSTGGTLRSPFQNIDWTNTHVVGANISGQSLTHSFRFGYVNFNNNITSTQVSGFEFPLAPSGTPIQLNVGDLSIGPNSLAPQQTYQDNWQGKYDGSWVAGNHVVRFGVDVNRILLGGFANFSGPMTFNGDVTACSSATDPFTCNLTDFAIGPNLGFFTATPAHGLPFGGKKNTRYAWYAGDQWKIKPNFSFNFGVRWTYDTNFFSSPDVRHLGDIDVYGAGLGDPAKYPKDAFSPQIGFAWDPWKDGKTSIRGGAYLAYEMNIFNNGLFDEFARITTGIGPTQLFSDSVHDPFGNPIVIATPPGCDPADVAQGVYECLQGRPISQVIPFVEQINTALQAAYANVFANYDPNVGESEFTATGGVTFGGQFPGDYKIPYSMQFNLGFQREIGRGHVISVDYVRQRGVGLPLQLIDYEARRDSRFFNQAAAISRRNAFLNGGCRTGVVFTVDQAIAQGCFNDPDDPTSGIFTPTVASFGMSSDAVWTGRTAQNLRARLVGGGFSLYQGLQVYMQGRFGDDWLEPLGIDRVFRGMSYTVGYSLSKNESTGGGGRPEFIANTTDNRDFNSDFGPNALDRTHNLTVSASMDLIGGFRLDQIWRVSTAPPLTITLPGNASANGFYRTDLNGDGGTGTTPRSDILPGTNIGDFGRKITNLTALNQYIVRFNNDVAGQLTPHGQTLVNAGVFTEAQIRALGGFVRPIALIPEGNPDPFETRWNADMRLSRPIRFGGERFVLEPSFSVFNVFNNNASLTYTGLSGAFGSLNFDYSDPADLAALKESRGLAFRRRQMQWGIRFTF
jgi:hypothetical protein